MGFLRASEPMSWEEAQASLRFVREHGIEQFLAVFRRCQHIQEDPFKWGDEVEHGIFSLTGDSADASRSVRVALRSPEVLSELRAAEAEGEQSAKAGDGKHEPCAWMPEYGRWMLESTPGRPFQGIEDAARLEANMKMRRERLTAALRPGEVAPTVTSMPLFGVEGFCDPPREPNGPAAASIFVPDQAIFPHPRFPTLTRNIRLRRGGRVEIRRPRLGAGDSFGCAAVTHAPVPSTPAEADALDHVYADAMAFGMGCCCLQVTMQAANLAESRYLYDQLAPLTPVMLALTAATPFLRGWICDDDTRWGQVAQSVDDRTLAERQSTSDDASVGDGRLAGRGIRALPKSRYDAIDCYIGEGLEAAKHNDVPLVVDEEYVKRLMDSGVDEALARHIAHLFARDPLVLFGDRIYLDDEHDIDHWENLQSTNWQTLRWKPPPPDKGALSSSAEGHIGWRVEFRSMEVQITDFENAAFTSFIVLLSRTIIASKLNLYIPMSKLEENMKMAQRKQACTEERFWFRTDVLPSTGAQTDDGAASSAEPYALMTVREILMGRGSYPGLIPLCRRHLQASGCDPAAQEALKEHLSFLEKRASGSLLTTATWMRSFVLGHEAYQHDARVPPAAAHDLMLAAAEIGAGTRRCPELVGERPLSQTTPVTASIASPPVGGEPRLLGARRPRCSTCSAAAKEQSPAAAAAMARCNCLAVA